MARKYARIFVRGHYLFLEAHSFPRASLSENCSLLGNADKYPSIFSRQMKAIVYIVFWPLIFFFFYVRREFDRLIHRNPYFLEYLLADNKSLRNELSFEQKYYLPQGATSNQTFKQHAQEFKYLFLRAFLCEQIIMTISISSWISINNLIEES